MKLLDGKLASQAIKNDLKNKVEELKKLGNKIPHLAAVLVGNNGASETYVASKVKSCEEIGFKSTLIRLEDNIKEICLQADIIIAALGIPEFLKADMVKENAVVIDVGITRVTDAAKKSGYSIKGDVDFENVAPKCSYITPVPGGVGPMTIAAL